MDRRVEVFKEHAKRTAKLYEGYVCGAFTEEQFLKLRDLDLEYCNKILMDEGYIKESR
jgi:hypothetical protein